MRVKPSAGLHDTWPERYRDGLQGTARRTGDYLRSDGVIDTIYEVRWDDSSDYEQGFVVGDDLEVVDE